MNKAKKLISAMLSVIMLITLLSGLTVFAAPPTSPLVSIGGSFLDGKLVKGTDYTATVNLSNLGSVYTVALPFAFNTDMIEITAITSASGITAAYEAVTENSGSYPVAAQKLDALNTEFDVSYVNTEGRFLLSFRDTDVTAPEIAIPATETPYFTINFTVKKDAVAATPTNWLFSEINKNSTAAGKLADGKGTAPFTADGVFGSIIDDEGAYYLADNGPYVTAVYKPLVYIYTNDFAAIDDGDLPDNDEDDEGDIPTLPPVVNPFELEDAVLEITAVFPVLPANVAGEYVVLKGETNLVDITAEWTNNGSFTGSELDVTWTVSTDGGVTYVAITDLLDDATSLTPEFDVTKATAGVTYIFRVTSDKESAIFDEVSFYIDHSVAIKGAAVLSGKQRIAVGSYTPDFTVMDKGIKVQLFDNTNTAIGNPVYTNGTNMTAAGAKNYELFIPSSIAQVLGNGNYFIRFTRIGNTDANGAAIAGIREESYLCAEIKFANDTVTVANNPKSTTTEIEIAAPTYLIAGAFYVPSENKASIGVNDLADIKAQVGNPNNATAWNINEYLGVEAADYSTVLRYMNKTKAAGTLTFGTGATAN